MSPRATDHATFEIVRTYEAAPARVFAAWADPQAKASWFGPSTAAGEGYTLDFAVDGSEHLTVAMAEDTYTYDARYRDIVEDERIIYTYEMHKNGERISVSLTTVVLEPAGEGTRLKYTEQGVFLDGLDSPDAREHGTRELLDALAASLQEGVGAV
jgi:uncharacterized protein YndB with AHSA1/START domain